MDKIPEVERLREEYEAALDEADARRAEYHRAVLKLHRSGMPLRQIAESLGLSHQRVHQIVTGERSSKGRRKRAVGGTALTLAVVLGLLTGYLRFAHLPPFELAKAKMVKMPDVSGLSLQQAAMVLRAFGFEVGSSRGAPSPAMAYGFVSDQRPKADTRAAASTAVALTYSLGPGPFFRRSAFVVQAVLIPITHTGSYSWSSPVVPVTAFKSGAAGFRFIGDVTANGPRPIPAEVSGGTKWTITFTVVRLAPPAWLDIVGIRLDR